MRILVTGAAGFLGSRLSDFYSERHDVISCYRDDMDLGSLDSVMGFMARNKPDAVIHCAALSNTGYCQVHEKESEIVNINATCNVAKACSEIGAKLVFMSSDQVYNAVTHMNACKENENFPEPANVYGRHKLEAERRTLSIMPSAVGLRLTWMYDSPLSRLRMNSNILVNIASALKENRKIRASVNEMRGMTNVWDVVRNIENAIQLPGGIYNFGCESFLDSYETFSAAARSLGIDPLSVIEKDDTFRRNLSMDMGLIRRYSIEFPSTIDGFFRTCLIK